MGGKKRKRKEVESLTVDIRDIHVAPANDLSKVYAGVVSTASGKVVWKTRVEVTEEFLRTMMVITGEKRQYRLSSGAIVEFSVRLIHDPNDKNRAKKELAAESGDHNV